MEFSQEFMTKIIAAHPSDVTPAPSRHRRSWCLAPNSTCWNQGYCVNPKRHRKFNRISNKFWIFWIFLLRTPDTRCFSKICRPIFGSQVPMFIVWIHLFSSESSLIPIFHGYPQVSNRLQSRFFPRKKWLNHHVESSRFLDLFKKIHVSLVYLFFPGQISLFFLGKNQHFSIHPHMSSQVGASAPPVASELPATGCRGVVRGPPMAIFCGWSPWFPHERYMGW